MKITSPNSTLGLVPKGQSTQVTKLPTTDTRFDPSPPTDAIDLSRLRLALPVQSMEPSHHPTTDLKPSSSESSRPAESHDPVTGVKATAAPNGTLFMEDEPGAPTYSYHEFDRVSDLARLPQSVKENFSQATGMRPQTFFRELLDTPKVKLESGDLSLSTLDGKTDWLEYNLSLKDPSRGSHLGRMSREFTFEPSGEVHVYHSFFHLNRSAQGQGVAKDLLSRSMELYDKIGVSQVSVCAAMQVGGYAWAKYGFKPEAGYETERLFETLRYRLDDLSVSSSTRNTVKRLLAGDKPEAIWAISDLNGVQVATSEGNIGLGKALLLGTSWAGTLDLKDPISRARFDHYIKKGSSHHATNS